MVSARWYFVVFTVSAVLANPGRVAAGEAGAVADPSAHEALLKTQALLRQPELRAIDAKGNPASAGASEQALQAGGGSPTHQQGVFELASDVFGEIFKQSGGDPIAMMELIEKAKKNPEAFGKSFSPEQKKKLEELSRRIAGESPPNP